LRQAVSRPNAEIEELLTVLSTGKLPEPQVPVPSETAQTATRR
jgi:hypothetical protein